MKFEIKKASKKSARLRMALVGLSGGGKTYTSLLLAAALGQRVVVIDTERGSASKYADKFDFDVLELDSFEPRTYCEAIHACEESGADVIVVDSLSHAWVGKGGALDQVDKVAKRQGGNSFGAWRDVTPQHNELVDTILRARAHVIVTMRAKTEHVQERDERTGKTVVKKLGLAAVQRDGMEYEFDVVCDINSDHEAIVSKTRCSALLSGGGVYGPRDTGSLAGALKAWLTDGAPAEPQPVPRIAERQQSREPAQQPANDPPAVDEAATRATFEALRAALDATKSKPVDECLRAIVSVWRGMGATVKNLPEDARKGLWTVARECVGSKWGTSPDLADAWLRAALKTPPSEPTPLPIRTSKKETLPTPEAVELHFRGLKSRKHLEAAARAHGSHPWARPELIKHGVAILETDASDVAQTIDAWALKGREESEVAA